MSDPGVLPSLSVVVSVRDRAADVLELLSTLRAVDGVVIDPVVVDNGSADETIARALDYWPALRVVARSDRSPARGLPHGIAAARAPFVALLDVDAPLEWPVLRAMFDHVRRTPRGIATAATLAPDGTSLVSRAPLPTALACAWPVLNPGALVAPRAWLMRQADFALRYGLSLNPADAALEALIEGYDAAASPAWTARLRREPTAAERAYAQRLSLIDRFEAVERHFPEEEARPLLDALRERLGGEPVLSDRCDPLNPPPAYVRPVPDGWARERFLAWVMDSPLPDTPRSSISPAVREEERPWLRGALPHHPEASARRRFGYAPVISLLLPLERPGGAPLETCLASLEAQTYPHWTLAAVDDGTADAPSRTLLKRFERRHPKRVRVVIRAEKRGRSATLQEAFDMAEGTYAAMLSPDGMLVPEALERIARALEREPGTDWLYTDEITLAPDGSATRLVKPCWAPELFLTTNYCGNMAIFRRALAREAGGFRGCPDDPRDDAFWLRLAERARRIRRLAEPLCVRPETPIPALGAVGCEVRREALLRRGVDARVEPGGAEGYFRLTLPVPSDAVDLVILGPTQGARETADGWKWQQGVRSGSVVAAREGERCIETLARACAAGAAPYLFLCETGTVPVGERTLALLLAWFSLEGAGMVSARCLFGDRVDHAGLSIAPGGSVLFPDRGLPSHASPAPAGAGAVRNAAALSPAATIVSAAALRACGGLPSGMTTAAGALLWLSLAMRARGLRLLVDGTANAGRMSPYVLPPEALPGGADFRACLRRFPGMMAGQDPWRMERRPWRGEDTA